MSIVYEYRNTRRDGDVVRGQRRTSGQLGEDSWINFSGDWDLLLIHEALQRDWHTVFPRVWALQDAYGAPGAGPAYDWSGIRDSSEEAVVAMAEIARTVVSDSDLERMLRL